MHNRRGGVHMILTVAFFREGDVTGDNNVYIEDGCVIEEGAIIYAPAHISGGAHICRGAVVYPFSFINASHVGENSVVLSSTLISAHIGRNSHVGPYAYLRDGATVGDNCRVGDFVEIKASSFGDGSKAAHHAYIGDAEVGKNVNIGCGVVFCNYDGKFKHKTRVGDGVFIGANCNIVAPLVIEDSAFIAAGTTLTCDIASGDFCIARSREKVLRGGAAGRYKNG